MKVSCIIPAYNEVNRIANVLDVVLNHELIDEIVVVDDGSTDNTKDVIVPSKKIKLISLNYNQGKSKAVVRGIEESIGDIIILLDSDLVGLSHKNLTDLIKPILDCEANVTISLRGNTPHFWKFIGIDYISGERVFPKNILNGQFEKIKNLPGFGLEVFINRLIIKNKCQIQVVSWANVVSPFKHVKYGLWTGIKSDIKMMWDIFNIISIFGPLYQIPKMLKLKIKGNSCSFSPKISLIIPAYNEEKYIGTCLEYAIKNSDGKFLEIIVVDNASTDRTAEIALQYPNVRVVHESRKGLTRARQCGYENAKGEILAYIDADTRMTSSWVQTVIDEFKENSNLACISGPAFYYDISKFHQFLVKILYWNIIAIPTYWVVGYMVMGSHFAIKRNVLEKMGGFDTNIEFYGEDTNIARRAHAFGKVKFTPKLTVYFSGRRLKNEGIYKTGLTYISNYLSEVIHHKPITKTYKDFR